MRAALPLLAGLLVLAGCGAAAQERPAFPDGAGDEVARPATDIPLGAAVTWPVLGHDAELQAAVDRGFDSITPENEMKWEVVEPDQGKTDFGDADALVDWARAHGKRIRGHTLVWHQQAPDWLGGRRWSARELEQVLIDHVKAEVGRYRGRVDTWDVVNEPFTDQGGWRGAKGFPFLDVLGPRYVEIALRAAHEADPGARLFVNEIGAEAGGPKLDALVRLARDLRGRGVPLDGIGLESHFELGKQPSRARIRQSIEALAATGVDVELTELDVATAADDTRGQAAAYAGAGAACAEVRACRRVTVWGVSDRDSWLGADQHPLPFDERLRAKPAWGALTGALQR